MVLDDGVSEFFEHRAGVSNGVDDGPAGPCKAAV
jgi:hypothetical protein